MIFFAKFYPNPIEFEGDNPFTHDYFSNSSRLMGALGSAMRTSSKVIP